MYNALLRERYCPDDLESHYNSKIESFRKSTETLKAPPSKRRLTSAEHAAMMQRKMTDEEMDEEDWYAFQLNLSFLVKNLVNVTTDH